MNRQNASIFYLQTLLICIVGLLFSACGGGGGTGSSTPSLHTLQVDLEKYRIINGIGTRAYASGIYSDNSNQDLSTTVQWNSSDTTVATIDSSGNITALQAGTSVISATIGNATATASLRVDEAILVSVAISPRGSHIAAGVDQQFSAIGEYSNGDNYDITSLASWSSSDSSIISISNTNKGFATAVAAGSASVQAIVGNITTTTLTTVTTATLSQIELHTPQTSLPVGASLQLEATGLFSDNSALNLSSLASWSSSNESIATVSHDGIVSALSSGTVQFTATYLGHSAAININISNAVITGLSVTPVNPVLVVSNRLQLHATAIYSDGVTHDVTDKAVWISANTAVATVGNSRLNRGLVSGAGVGNSSISAYFDGQSDQAALKVSAATLQNLEISPSSAVIALGTVQQFSVIGHYNDGSTRTLTDQAYWSSIDSSITESQGNGLFKSIATGHSLIVASLNDVTAFTSVDVSAAILNNITLSPSNGSTAAGYSVQFKAIGHYSDTSTQDISDRVLWHSDNTSIASISNATNSKGLMQAIASGSATISAALDGISSNTAISATAAVLESIEVQVNSSQLNRGDSQQYSAIGHFSDSSTQDISSSVTWSSSNNSVAEVSNAAADKGSLAALAAGTVTITAASGNITGSSTLNVVFDPNAPVSLSLGATPNVILNNGSDSTTLNVTLLPADESGSIADNTPVDVTITEGAINNLYTIYTSNGVASINISSTYDGFIGVQASVGGKLIKTGYLFSTSNFTNVVARNGYKYTQYNGTTLLTGSWFAMFVKNLSSRTFNVSQYTFNNGANSNIIPGTSISGGLLSHGESYGVMMIIDNDQIDNGITSVMSFNDSNTTQNFDIGINFTIP